MATPTTKDLECGLLKIETSDVVYYYDNGIFWMSVLVLLTNIWVLILMYNIQEDLNVILRIYAN